jgi:hypothetical protein
MKNYSCVTWKQVKKDNNKKMRERKNKNPPITMWALMILEI